MIPGQFDYVRPGNLDETLQILKDREGEAKLLSGGYSLLPLIKLRLAQPALLVDLRDVDRPRRHRRDRRRPAHRRPGDPPPDPRERRSSATATRSSHDVTGDDRRSAGPQLGHDRRLRRPRRPGLRLAGGPARGATPRSSAAARPASATIAARDFFLDTFTTAIEPTEVLTEIRIRPPADGHRRRLREARAQGRRLRHRRRRARSSGSDDGGTIERAGIGVTGRRRRRRSRRPTPRRVLVGNAAVGRACSARPAPPPAAQSRPFGDVRGPVDYKRAMAAELTLRALRTRRRTRPRVRVGGRHDDHPAHLGHRQRRGPRGRRRAAPPARPLPARRPRADRHPHRLRHEQLRRLHRPRRRPERQVLHDARRPGRRPRDQDDRGDGRRRHPPPAPAGVLGPARPPVRLLHAGDDHAGRPGCSARTRTRPRRRSARGSAATCAAAPAT